MSTSTPLSDLIGRIYAVQADIVADLAKRNTDLVQADAGKDQQIAALQAVVAAGGGGSTGSELIDIDNAQGLGAILATFVPPDTTGGWELASDGTIPPQLAIGGVLTSGAYPMLRGPAGILASTAYIFHGRWTKGNDVRLVTQGFLASESTPVPTAFERSAWYIQLNGPADEVWSVVGSGEIYMPIQFCNADDGTPYFASRAFRARCQNGSLQQGRDFNGCPPVVTTFPHLQSAVLLPLGMVSDNVGSFQFLIENLEDNPQSQGTGFTVNVHRVASAADIPAGYADHRFDASLNQPEPVWSAPNVAHPTNYTNFTSIGWHLSTDANHADDDLYVGEHWQINQMNGHFITPGVTMTKGISTSNPPVPPRLITVDDVMPIGSDGFRHFRLFDARPFGGIAGINGAADVDFGVPYIRPRIFPKYGWFELRSKWTQKQGMDAKCLWRYQQVAGFNYGREDDLNEGFASHADRIGTQTNHDVSNSHVVNFYQLDPYLRSSDAELIDRFYFGPKNPALPYNELTNPRVRRHWVADADGGRCSLVMEAPDWFPGIDWQDMNILTECLGGQAAGTPVANLAEYAGLDLATLKTMSSWDLLDDCSIRPTVNREYR